MKYVINLRILLLYVSLYTCQLFNNIAIVLELEIYS